MTRTCVSPACGSQFEPHHDGHIWCSQMCRQSVFKTETGKDLSGAFGFMSDRDMVRAFDARWGEIARAQAPAT